MNKPLALIAFVPLLVWAQTVTPEERLFEALHESKPLVAEGIVARGRVDLNAKNQDGDTPLQVAIEKNYRELAAMLVKAGSPRGSCWTSRSTSSNAATAP